MLNFNHLNLIDRYTLLESLPYTFKVGMEIGVWQGWYTAQMIQKTRPYFTGNLLYHPAYKKLRLKHDYKKFHNANLATRNSILIGTYIGITDEKIKKIDNTLASFFERVV